MKAIVLERYGGPEVLAVREVEKPTPGDDEVLVKVCAASVNAADWHIMRADPFLVRFAFGMRRPKNPKFGADLAGVVEEVGSSVIAFRAGDAVFGDLSAEKLGAFAEYAVAKESTLALKPANLSFEEAAGVPMAAVTAYQGLRQKGRVRAGQRVLVNGASGGVGTFAVQIAKAFGAEVTAVCSTAKVEMVKTLGADNVIDYTHEDFTRGEKRFDLIFAANGYQPLWRYRRVLAPRGRYVMAGGQMRQMWQAMLLGPMLSMGGKRMGSFLCRPNGKDLDAVRKLIEEGKVRPVIDRSYPLERAAEAVAYVEDGHATGKVILTVAP